jgi:hypothetical protein
MRLEITKTSDPRLLDSMAVHYSQPKGFVGRSICYAVLHNGVYYGHTVGGSATMHLPGRHDALGTRRDDLNSVVNNIFFHVSPVDGRYPYRNFVPSVVAAWREQIYNDWKTKYGDDVYGYETLVEPPRTGECYLRDGWKLVGQTKGQTCKRGPGKGTDSWGGRRVWDKQNLRPKLVFVYPLTLHRVRQHVA